MNAEKAGVIPLVGLTSTFFALWVATFLVGANSFTYTVPYPFSSADSTFLSASMLIGAYFFARSFLVRRAPSLLVLGAGSLMLGSGFLLSQVLGNPPFGGPTQLVGMTSIVFLFSAAIFGVAGLLNFANVGGIIPKPALLLSLAYVFALAAVLFSIWIVESESIPAFFVAGAGPTLIRQEFAGATIVLFLFSSWSVNRAYIATRSPSLYWFTLGIATIALGLVCALPVSQPGDLFSWLTTASLAMGGIYVLAAVQSTYRTSPQLAT